MRFIIVFVKTDVNTEIEIRYTFEELYTLDPTLANNLMANVIEILSEISKYPGDDYATDHPREEWVYPGTLDLTLELIGLQFKNVYTVRNNPYITGEFLTGYLENLDPIGTIGTIDYTLDFIELEELPMRGGTVFSDGHKFYTELINFAAQEGLSIKKNKTAKKATRNMVKPKFKKKY
jgi:hypothetical protein